MFIVATISKSSYTADKIEEIIRAGATVLRYNFSHGTPAEMTEKISVAKSVIAKLGLVGAVKIMADLPGDKIRLGDWPAKEHLIAKGERHRFVAAEKTDDPSIFIPINKDHIATFTRPGQIITLGDGELAFEINEIVDEQTFFATAINSGKLMNLKGVNIGRAIDELDHITPKTIEHLKNLDAIAPDWVAFSFVHSGEFVRRARALLAEHAPSVAATAKIVSKVESPQAMARIGEIIEESDIILVARGDLGLTVPIEELGIHQKRIVKLTKAAGKLVIVSTQILESLLTAFTPLRSDVLDLTNIVLDGADGIMLAKETGMSATPGYSVEVAKKIIEYVEAHRQQI